MADYSVPRQAQELLSQGILNNPLIQKDLPPESLEAAQNISFEGNDAPSIPINWRFAESISALKAFEAVLINVLLKRKYGVDPPKVKINTDHAQLFIMSSLLWTLDPDGDNLSASSMMSAEGRTKIAKSFPNWDKHAAHSSPFRQSATNIYRTKDGKFFHLHGSLNPDPTLESIGLPKDMPCTTLDEARKYFEEAVGKHSADEMQHIATDLYKQAGTICYTTEEFKQSEHGEANAHIGLFDIKPHSNSAQSSSWWPDSPSTSAARPLAGLKVVELTRIIAGPAIGRGLAELGASVMRVTAPHLPDISTLHLDLNHGKWNACLDLRKEEDRLKLRDLVLDADVFLQGYRPGVLDKYGFGENDIFAMCKNRDRGIIYARENCYGWQGPWAHRSGWQQISDANVGVSYEFGRAMGNDEPVTPIFPNSDYCTGIAGVAGILTALLRRAEKGGSYTVDMALNYYSQWLVNSCGVYPEAVWKDVYERNGSPVFRHYHGMPYTLPRTVQSLQKNSGTILFKPDFFKKYHVKYLKKDVKIVAPVLQYPDGEVKPGYHVGTRTNGVDQAKWPLDLSVENVV